jgi:hypothetical protein
MFRGSAVGCDGASPFDVPTDPVVSALGAYSPFDSIHSGAITASGKFGRQFAPGGRGGGRARSADSHQRYGALFASPSDVHHGRADAKPRVARWLGDETVAGGPVVSGQWSVVSGQWQWS